MQKTLYQVALMAPSSAKEHNVDLAETKQVLERHLKQRYIGGQQLHHVYEAYTGVNTGANPQLFAA
jgi:hypothetical protein